MLKSKLFTLFVVLTMTSCSDRRSSPSPPEAGGQVAQAHWSAANVGRLDLLAVDFIDERTGWATGDIDPAGVAGGAVLHTTDGGRSWQKVAATNEIFEAIQFVTAARGWVAGYAGRIERTDDGGRTWKRQRSERKGEVLNSVFFLDENHGWSAGGTGLVLRTENGGDSWDVIDTSRAEDLWDVRFVTPERGWIVGEEGLILATSDGGRTWAAQESETARSLFSLTAPRSDLLVAVGEGGTILRSEDGIHWNRVESNTAEMLYAVAANGDIVWAVGTRGVTLGSSDGARTWVINSPVTPRDLFAVDLPTPSHGVAVGQKGTAQVLTR